MSEQRHNPRECWCGIDHSRTPRCEKCGGPRPGEFITCSLAECPYATNPRDAANEPDVTDDPGGPATYRVRFDAEYDVEVEIEEYGKGTTYAEVQQAIQDALGYTGLRIIDVTEYEEIP